MEQKIGKELPVAQALTSEAQFQEAVLQLTRILQETITEVIPMTKPSVHMNRWWNRDLEQTKIMLNRLSGMSH